MPLNILWSIHLYPPAHNCGSEYVSHNVNKFLLSKGHNVRVILHYHKGDPYMYEGVEVFPATGSVDAYRWADLIMTHLDMTQFTIVMAKTAQRPIVHFVHNDIPYSSIMNATVKVGCVYNSNWIKDKIGYIASGYVLHPPCDAQDYMVERTGDYITLISLNERKGGYRLYEIAKAMQDKKFLGVIGSYDNPGDQKLPQIDIVNMLMQLPNVEIVPNTPDIISTYRRTRILLMPSDYESWGRTATEAMCSGIPVICTPTPGLKENCGDAAVYVGEPLAECDPGDPQVTLGTAEDWVKAIRAMDNPATYQKYSVLSVNRATALNPVAELEGLEQFLIQQVYA